MNTCTATTNPRDGVALRCDRQAGHETISSEPGDPVQHMNHYDFHQDATWFVDAWGAVRIAYRTVTS